MNLDANLLKKDFPILDRKINGSDLVYLDNAATSQKPQAVIDSMVTFYSKYNANIHRGIYTISEEATSLYENSRKSVADFINSLPEEIIFTKGTTESLNILSSWAETFLKKGDVVLITEGEHHSNLIPWQVVCKKTGATLEYVKIDENGNFPIENFKEKLNEFNGRIKIVSMFHVSNVLGNILPVKEITKLAKEKGAYVIVDGAQAVPHMKVNVKDLGCDFYAFSAHKMLGPTGVGVLWGKKEILEKIEPVEFGGGMMREVTFENSTWADMPHKFEAGTPNIGGVAEFSSAINYLKNVGMENIEKYERELVSYACEKLAEIQGLRILGTKNMDERSGLVSFSIEGIHPHDIASVLSAKGICVRAGQHCAAPLHKKLGIMASTRASFYFYNTTSDINALASGVKEAIKILS